MLIQVKTLLKIYLLLMIVLYHVVLIVMQLFQEEVKMPLKKKNSRYEQ